MSKPIHTIEMCSDPECPEHGDRITLTLTMDEARLLDGLLVHEIEAVENEQAATNTIGDLSSIHNQLDYAMLLDDAIATEREHSVMRRQVVVLEIEYDGTIDDEPSRWDWTTLAHLGSHEYAKVLAAGPVKEVNT